MKSLLREEISVGGQMGYSTTRHSRSRMEELNNELREKFALQGVIK